MAAHGLARTHGGGHFGQHLRITVHDTGKVHHLAQTDDAGPCHRLGHVIGADLETGGFKTGGGWRAGRHLREYVDGLHQRLVMHHPHAAQAKNIGNLMRVGEHRRRAMRDHGGGEFGRRQHPAFDMHVTIAEARDQVTASRLDHLGIRADAMAGVRADIGETPGGDGDLPVQHLARLHIDQFAATDDHVGRAAACGDSDQMRSNLRPRFDVIFHSQN